MKYLLLLISLVLISACTWVKETKEGKAIYVALSKDKVTNCKQVGATTTKVLDKVVFERNTKKVAKMHVLPSTG